MNSTFLSDFIMITSFKTVAFIIVLLAVLFGINVMAKKKVKFSTRMIVSTIVGVNIRRNNSGSCRISK